MCPGSCVSPGRNSLCGAAGWCRGWQWGWDMPTGSGPPDSLLHPFLIGNYLDKIEWLVCALRDECGERPEVEGED